MDKRYIGFIPVILFAFSIAASLFSELLISIPMLFAGILIDRLLKPGAGKRQGDDADLIAFVEVLRDAYLTSGSLLLALKTSMGGHRFSHSLTTMMLRYESGIKAEAAFSEARNAGPAALSQLLRVLANGLDNGDDVAIELALFLKEAKERERYRIRHSGPISGMLSMNRLGSAAFFPAFAGICVNILGFSGIVSGTFAQISSTSMATVLFTYIVISNYINSRNELRGSGLAAVVESSILYSAIGSLIFKAAFMVSASLF